MGIELGALWHPLRSHWIHQTVLIFSMKSVLVPYLDSLILLFLLFFKQGFIYCCACNMVELPVGCVQAGTHVYDLIVFHRIILV